MHRGKSKSCHYIIIILKVLITKQLYLFFYYECVYLAIYNIYYSEKYDFYLKGLLKPLREEKYLYFIT